jgi:hypothetical protein
VAAAKLTMQIKVTSDVTTASRNGDGGEEIRRMVWNPQSPTPVEGARLAAGSYAKGEQRAGDRFTGRGCPPSQSACRDTPCRTFGWTLDRNGQTARAEIVSIEGIGLELRYTRNPRPFVRRTRQHKYTKAHGWASGILPRLPRCDQFMDEHACGRVLQDAREMASCVAQAVASLQETVWVSRLNTARSRALRGTLNAPNIARFCGCGSVDVYTTLRMPHATYRRCRSCGDIWVWHRAG